MCAVARTWWASKRLLLVHAEPQPLFQAELAAALYEHGPGKAIEKLASLLRALDELGEIRVSDPDLAATQLNWLVMGEPLNRAMMLGEDASAMTNVEIERHVVAALDVFLGGVR